jgi:exosortase
LWHFFGNASKGWLKTDSVFWWCVGQWIDPVAETEHGWLILGLSGWLLWRNLRRSGPGQPGPAAGGGAGQVWPALVAMMGGLALHAVGFIGQQARISIVALLLYAWGVLRLGGGRRWGAAAVFPLGFLLFAIPLNMIDEVGLPLRMAVTSAGQKIAHACGIEVLRSGTQLLSPDGKFNYDVAAPCSGVRSLVALTALSLLIGYLEFRTVRRRVLVLLASFPLVYLGNVARIVAIILAAAAGGPEWGDRAHEVMGYGVFVIVLGGVLGVAALLRRWWPEAAEPEAGRAIPAASTPTDPAALPPAGSATPDRPGHPIGDTSLAESGVGREERRGRGPVLVAAAVVLLVGAEMAGLRYLSRQPARGAAGVALAADGLNPVELPAFLGTEWIGRRAEVTAVEREVLPADTGYSRKLYVAVGDPRRQVFLSIVLSGRDRTSIHRPELCLVGQGWTIAETARHRFAVPGNRRDFPAALLRVRREVRTPKGTVVVPQLVAYWFIGGDEVVASHWARVALDSWNRVTRGRVDRWAYVLMQTDATDGEAAALGRLQAVIDETLPVFAPQLRAGASVGWRL